MKNNTEGTPHNHFRSNSSSEDFDETNYQQQERFFLNELFRIAFDCVPCHGAIVDYKGTIIAVNNAWYEMSRMDDGDKDQIYEGANYLEICEKSKDLFSAGGRPFANGLRSVLNRQIDRFEMEYPLRTVTETQWFLGRVNGFEISNKRYAFILHENISEYKDKEIQNLSKQTQIPTLLETVKSVISMLDLQELLNTILKKLEKLIRYNAAGIFTYEGDMLIMQAYQGPPISDQPPVIFKPKGRYSEIQRIISTSHSFYIENINEMPGLVIEISDMLKLKIDNLKRFHSWLFLPMIFKENGIGIMVLSYHKEAHYDHDALRIGQLFSNYAAIAIQNAHLYELSQNSGVLKERNRLAFELHDSIAQLLFSINLYANAAQKALTMDKLEITKSHLEELQNLASDAVREMRLMIFELNDQLLDEFNIVKALQARFDAVEEKQRIKTELNLEGDLILPRQIEGEVYGIIQDIITYVGEITNPQKISLNIVVGDDQVLFNIISDSSFDIQDISVNDDFEKINRIRSRIRKIGGSLKLEVSSTIGTVINFNLVI